MDVPPRLQELAVSDKGFVFDPISGDTFSVNATGLLVLRGLQHGDDREALVSALREDFEVAGDDPGRGVDEFVATLRRLGLLPRDFDW